MRRFDFNPTPINDLLVITSRPVGDARGLLDRLFCQETLGHLTQGKMIRQINRTVTRKKGTVRGLHFQHPPYAETKIVSCLRGKVLDVAVDLRKGSPTFLQHHAVLLTAGTQCSYLIPEGFAHGFQTLTTDCEMLYFHTADYNSSAEGTLNALDPRLAINWPATIIERSERDTCQSMLVDDFQGLEA